jgi:predicted acyltransferase (DUF342 family)
MPAILIKKRHGFITPLALVAALFLFIIGLGLLTIGFHRRLYSIRSNHQLNARCAADYGLTRAVYEMNSRLSPLTINDANLPAASNVAIPANDAKYSYTVTKNGGTYIVSATGRSGPVTKTVLADLRLKSAFEYAILTKNTLDIGSVSTVDCNGCDIIPLKIGTTNNPTSEILLKPNSVVNGDIIIGQDGTPAVIVGSGATITGGIYAVATDFDLPIPSVPAGFDTAPTIAVTSSSSIDTPGKYVCSKIDLKNGGTLNINANVELYVTGDITLKNGADIYLAPGVELTIYLAGSFDGYYGAGFNYGGDPRKLSIYGLGTNDIVIKNSDAFAGTIYAPNADVHLYNSAKVYGSVIANNYKQDNSALFTYDARLRQASIDDEFVRFVPTHWREQ